MSLVCDVWNAGCPHCQSMEGGTAYKYREVQDLSRSAILRSVILTGLADANRDRLAGWGFPQPNFDSRE